MTIEIDRSNNQDIDGILWGWAWGDGGSETLNFSFPISTAEYAGYTAINSFSAFNSDQQEAVRDILSNIASFCNLTFIETTAPGVALRYAEATAINYTNNSSVATYTGLHSIGTAEANPPELGFNGSAPSSPLYAQGDSWFNPSNYDNPVSGNYEYQTIMHETGHNLGLKHGHVTQVGHGVTFPTLPADHDSQEYSVMTYRQFPSDNPNNGYNNLEFPTTYMQDDIAALQYLYGANYGASAHNGSTVYTWSTTTGEAFIDGVGQGAPIANYVLMTIWDGGGIDTYDFSNYTTDLSVDLNPGAWTILDTSAARAQRADLGTNGDGGPTYFARGNIANALIDPNIPSETFSLIENAIGGSGDDLLVGNKIGNTLRGGRGNDRLIGGAGTDFLHGGDGNDAIVSDGDGGDYFGGAGDDAMYSGLGAEYMNGGAGIDLIDHRIYNGDYTFYMDSGATQFGTETFVNFEHARMGDGQDVVYGTASDNQIAGGGGNDWLIGGAGQDSLFGEAGADIMYGEAGDDWLVGGAGVNTVFGGDGNDAIVSGGEGGGYFGDAGDDAMYSSLGLEYMNGGDGIDWIDHTSFNGSYYSFNMVTGTTQIVGETFLSFEHARMGNGHDTVYGTAADNEIDGGGGNDYLVGLDGDDTLRGGNGDDQLDGRAGADILDGGNGTDQAWYGDAAAGVTVNLALTTAQNTGGAGIDTLVSMENLAGSNFNDSLSGNAGDNELHGQLGTDTVSYAGATAGVTVNLALVREQNTVGAGIDTLLDIENLTGSNFNDTLTGNAGNNVLNGAVGTDTVSYAGATGGVTVNLGVATAQNTVGAGTDTLSNFENLRGSNFNDTLTGNTGNNVLNGGTGTDTLSYATATAGVTVNLGLTTAQNTVGAGTDTLSNFENLRGSNFNDTLTGNMGNNVLSGLGGHDTLAGGLGNDQLNGGSGQDKFVFNTALNATTNKDSITGFSAVDDQLVLENAIFTKFTTTGAIPAGTFLSGAGAVALDANDYLIYNRTTGTISYDADGNGAGAAVAFVTLLGNPAITSADFTII